MQQPDVVSTTSPDAPVVQLTAQRAIARPSPVPPSWRRAGKAFEDPGAVGDGDARPVVVDVRSSSPA
ncbi:hypothetical protein GS436_20080 [Rhodococcus hoagii]|nr:hypothetical protein [Prescottella equi]